MFKHEECGFPSYQSNTNYCFNIKLKIFDTAFLPSYNFLIICNQFMLLASRNQLLVQFHVLGFKFLLKGR